MGKIMKNGVVYSGNNTVEVTQEEYDTLTQAQKENGTIYFVTDGVPTALSAEDISSKIAFGSAWTNLHRSAYKVGNMVYFTLEGYTSSFVAGTEYTMATVSDYLPAQNYPFTGHTTDGNFKPIGLVTCFAKADGSVTVRPSVTGGNYFFVSGFYKIA